MNRLWPSEGRARVAAVAEAEVVKGLPVGINLIGDGERSAFDGERRAEAGKTNGEGVGIANNDEQLFRSSHGDVEPVEQAVSFES